MATSIIRAGNADAQLVAKLQNTGGLGVYTKTALSAVCFANDLKNVHFHANDEDFDKTHNLAGDYYDHMGDETDYLCELALEHKEEIPNLSLAAEAIGWPVETGKDYSYSKALTAIEASLGRYMTALHTLRTGNITTDVQSWLDDVIRHWSKERDYRLARREGRG